MEMKEMPRRCTTGLTHLVDIHELPEEDDEEQNPTKEKRGNNKAMKMKRENKSFSRQVSLETGFSVHNRERNGRNALPRSGKSFGGFGSAYRSGTEGRKGDFNMFRTKSSLVRQNSKLPLRKETGNLDEAEYNDAAAGLDLHINKSVPAGRYFAALTGPELDQVKTIVWIFIAGFRRHTITKGQEMAIPPPFPDRLLRHMSRPKQPGHPMAFLSHKSSYQITPHLTHNQPIHLAARPIHPCRSIHHLHTQMPLLFRSSQTGILPPHPCQLLLRPVGGLHVPSHRVAPTLCTGRGYAPGHLVRLHHPHRLPRPQDLRPVALWGEERLCKVANPSSHLSVVGNFVGAILAARVGWAEAGKFLWAIGFAHYLVVFVTLYQRLPTSEALPKELHPVYSMFIATPAAASIAWGAIYGEFDGLAKTCYFMALFLYCSLIVRINFFRGFRFSVAWWSYTFPMTTASIASIKYAEESPSFISKALALGLSFMSSTMVSMLFVSTLLHAFVWQTLFPNDLAIAITKTRQGNDRKPIKKAYDIRRWTKQSPLSLVSNIRKQNSPDKDADGDN